jgi:hypothetical protein
VARVGEAAKAALGSDDRAAFERSKAESVELEHGPGLWIGDGQHVEPVVEQEPVDEIRSHPSPDRVGAFEHDRNPSAGDESVRAGKAGDARPDDDDVVFFGHDRERTEASQLVDADDSSVPVTQAPPLEALRIGSRGT